MKIKELGHVVLYVTDIEKMAGFYRNILGFMEVGNMEVGLKNGAVAFSSGRTHHELLLIEIGGVSKHDYVPRPGLYHIGFKVADSSDELKEVFSELKEKGVTIIGTSDHVVTHSIYILDPDGNELELYADISDDWKNNPELVMSRVRPLNLD